MFKQKHPILMLIKFTVVYNKKIYMNLNTQSLYYKIIHIKGVIKNICTYFIY